VISLFQSEVGDVNSMNFNNDSSLLCLFGHDEHNRTKGVIYDIASVHQGREPKLCAKQLTDFDVL